MRYRPEQKQNRESTGKGAHYIHALCGSCRIIAKQNNKDPAYQYKKRCARRMRDLHFKTTAYKFAAIPEASTGFTCHYINCTCNQANCPACNVIDALKAHVKIFEMVLVFKGSKPNVNN